MGEIVFFRAFFALIPLFVYLALRGRTREAFEINSLSAHGRRTMAGLLGMFFGFAALAHLPLADATAVSYVAPLLVVPLSALFLNEPIKGHRLLGTGIGFVGVMILLSPHMTFGNGPASPLIGALFGLTGAVLSAIAMVQVKQITGRENPSSIVFVFMTATAAAALLTVPFGWVMPLWHEALGMVLMGVLGGVGQILVTNAYRYAPASSLAPFDYLTMVWAVVIGFVLFGDWPEPVVFTGMGLVLLAGLYVLVREGRRGSAALDEV